MGARGLQSMEIRIPLAFGLQQKNDPRSLLLPALSRCVDVQFDEIGGIQTRHPYQAKGTLTNCRRLAGNGPELVGFTTTGLSSWSPALGAWASRGTHLAIHTDEETVFGNASDQTDCDRAELDGVIWYSWTENADGFGYCAAVDAETGAVLMPRTVLSTQIRTPRLVALATKVLLIAQDSTGLYFWTLDPATPTTIGSATGIITSGLGATTFYDVCQVGTSDTAILAARRSTTTSYSLATITAAGVVTATTVARDCTGAIAVSVPPGGTQVQVIRANGTNVQGDLITISGWVDVYTAQAIGTTPTNPAQVIAACHRSVQNSGEYRCYAFWSSDETSSGGSDWYSSSNWAGTSGTLGTAAVFKRRWAPRARAFDRSGEVYVWGASFGASEFDPFGSRTALQSSYFLLRDDGFLAAKAVTNTAGAGAGGASNDGNGWLPGCQDLGGGSFAFAGMTCRVIKTESGSVQFAARSPRDVTFTFDSNKARRTARIGSTLYIACAEGLLQYDGANITEVGFHQAPWYIVATEDTTGAIVVNGTYAYKFSWRSANAKGETERSTSAAVGSVTVASQPAQIVLAGAEPLYLTHKTSVAWEAWRTAVDPTADAAFYRVTADDPTDTTNPNRYVTNDTSLGALPTVNDGYTDTVLTTQEEHPEDGGSLENMQFPPCSIVVANADRLFVAGVAGSPHTVMYSKRRGAGEVVAWNDALQFTVPREGGDITALAFLNETLIVFKETAIYAVTGDGLDNAGGGQPFGAPRQLSADVGAESQEAVAFTPGGLVFKSRKGWQLLNRGWAVDYIGGPVSDYDDEEVLAVHVLEKQHQIRCLTATRALVFDYLVQQWSEWTIVDGVHACMWDGTYHYATAANVYGERTDFTGLNYGFDIETAPIPLSGIQGFGRVWTIEVLGEYQGTGGIRFRLAANDSVSYFQDKTWPPSGYVAPSVGEAIEIEHRPSRQEMRSLKIRMTATGIASGEDTLWAPHKLTSLALEVGVERYLNRITEGARQ